MTWPRNVWECVKQLKAGYMAGLRRKYYLRLRHVVKKNTYIKCMMASHRNPDTGKPCALCSLWRHLKKVEPTLTRRTIRFTFKLMAAHKAAGVAYCHKILAMTPAQQKRYLVRVVWIDSKKLLVVPRGLKVYALVTPT